MKSNMQQLLLETENILHLNMETQKKKGEKFNVFSILKMETKENGTHSAFLKELLDPNGTHLQGNTFLKLFLETIHCDTINLRTAKVKTEHYIGVRNDAAKTGGRVDIYIWDERNCITIENKINAPDLNAQIERYCNHKKGNNRVYYLTLFGSEPTAESKGSLEPGKDFYIISYQKDIVQWLTKCLEAFTDATIIRESIKQYIILIQKLTFKMPTEEEKDLDVLMLNHFNEASHISANFQKAKERLTEEIRIAVFERLKLQFGDEFNIYLGERDTRYRDSPIWLKYKAHDDRELFFGVESFSPLATEEMYVGVFSLDGKATDYAKNEYSEVPHWPVYYNLENDNPEEGISLADSATLQKLNSDEAYRKWLIDKILSEVEKIISKHRIPLLSFLNNKTVSG